MNSKFVSEQCEQKAFDSLELGWALIKSAVRHVRLSGKVRHRNADDSARLRKRKVPRAFRKFTSLLLKFTQLYSNVYINIYKYSLYLRHVYDSISHYVHLTDE